jgi:deoxyribodipyrimidine photolyase-like uncharacterized protein
MKSAPSSPCRHLVLVLGDQLNVDSAAFDAFDPAQCTGPTACPFTTLYWDFRLRHEAMLKKNPRTAMQSRHATRLSVGPRREITDSAARLREAISTAT